MDALNANEEGGENRLNKTELFTIYLPNLLVSPEESDNFTGVSGELPLLVSASYPNQHLLIEIRK